MTPPERAYGADRIERTGPEGDDELVLVCPMSKGWDPRTLATTVRPAHPGTTVSWEERLFEVRTAEPLAEGGMRYRLAPWEDGQAIRRFERYDDDTERAREAERQERADGIRKRRRSILLAPLAGLLPGAVQKKMETDFGAPAVAMTIASAIPLFVIGFLGLFRTLLMVLGGLQGVPGGDWPRWLAPDFPIALYLTAESALRLGSAIAQGEPMGSLPVVLAYTAWTKRRSKT